MMMSINSLSSSLGAQKQNKKNKNKPQLVVIFFGCKEIKQKKQKQAPTCRHFSQCIKKKQKKQ